MPLTIRGTAYRTPAAYKAMVEERFGEIDVYVRIGMCVNWLSSIDEDPGGSKGQRVVEAFNGYDEMKAELSAHLRVGGDITRFMWRAGLYSDPATCGDVTGFGAAVELAAHKIGGALLLVRTEQHWPDDRGDVYEFGVFRTGEHVVLYAPLAGEFTPINFAARDIDSHFDFGHDRITYYVGYRVVYIGIGGPTEKAPPPPPDTATTEAAAATAVQPELGHRARDADLIANLVRSARNDIPPPVVLRPSK